ncbi:MAG TPA: MarR family transcriptional regulator [Candidatus Pacearchaeota archaeon]|nr:MarR family transcriptional regulator [Candidatus Pacearchaeota archaeon]
MKNKHVGFLIVGISVILGLIVTLFNVGMKKIVTQSCSHGSTCTMYDTISSQTYLSIAIAGIIFVIGLFLIFAKENVIIKTRTVKEKKKSINLKGLDKTEQEVVKILQAENGAIFQKDLMERLGIGKVGITRLIDKLEAKQLVERKRRGMNNIVVLKQ